MRLTAASGGASDHPFSYSHFGKCFSPFFQIDGIMIAREVLFMVFMQPVRAAHQRIMRSTGISIRNAFFQEIRGLGLCEKGQDVLDPGTGTGVLPRHLSRYGAHFTGMDISENQIKQMRRLTKKTEGNGS